MIKYVLCYAQVSKWSFLDATLGLADLSKLRLGEKTYLQLLCKLRPFHEAKFVSLYTQLPELLLRLLPKLQAELSERQLFLDKGESVCVLNLRYFPCDLRLIEAKLSQAAVASQPLVIRESSSRANLVAAVFKAEYLKEQSSTQDYSDYSTFTCPHESVADLNDAVTVMQLFNHDLVTRHFNALTSGRIGYFLKSSRQQTKMQAEYSFLSALPSSLRPFYPQIGDFYTELEDGKSGYEVEQIPTLDVSKFLINGYFARTEHCELLLGRIEQYFRAIPSKTVEVKTYQDVITHCFIEKGQRRLEQLLQSPEVEKLNQIARLCGVESVETFTHAYLQLLQDDVNAHTDTELYYSHGDLFFGNMLYDPQRQLLKLIDPKGSDRNDCYLPIWYDLAKLSHSFLGHYDLMVYNLIEPVLADRLTLGLKILPELENSCVNLATAFKTFLQQHHLAYERVRLYEGSLFLSMLPLHTDSPLRMACQLLQAIAIYKSLTKTE